MLHKRWQGCMFFIVFLLRNASAMIPSENSPSEFAKIVQSKQTKQARVCGAEPQLLSSLAETDAEVMLTIPNEQLERIAKFQEEADLWVVTNVARFLPAIKITHVLAGDDVLINSPGNAYFLVPAMIKLRSALAAAGLDGRVKVSSVLSVAALVAPAWSDVVGHVLRFLKGTGSPLFLKSRPSESTNANVDGAMRALGVSGVPVIPGELGARGEMAVYYYSYYPRGRDDQPGSEGGKRRSLATGTFCVALQNADPTALQAGLDWACGPGHADCSAIQPGGPCYKQNNLAALASYAYNDYYRKMASTGATCSFNGTATTTTNDPSSGSCVFAGSSMAGGSNSSVPVGASPPTSLAPPAGFAPPVGSSPPSSDFSPPTFGTAPPTGFAPPGSFNGSGTFGGGPSGTLYPYNGGCRGAVSRAGLSALSAVALAVLLVSMDVM
ncbi:glucan endo-1,3-beta-glucosidase 1-like [Phragmites australis]|uniref:glucan endo-1,3-beta-glucosidase 1-like n=1 Tax=Phragmites australis TaxID=29695 RepID=UPI002D781385|nr:glucan endo-1,3-beta-glucosidase 1-like [Phragmites australis]XP_062215490.1 glucan endo-1,3-beta-glucosidase 1-like [Phragmites australis]XP_062215491.1 glucan endo-1,3-beta-glucosidase 1-like [Phragmites australis]XP_062215492.1 glucan endo-1,3-beta-glucosidase 1-like [Phragmites australis]